MSDTLEFLQRPNGADDLPVAAPIQPLGGEDPAPNAETVEVPHEEVVAKTEPTPAPKPKQESQPNGAPVESKQEKPQTADMSYADIASKGPKQTDEEKYVTLLRAIASIH